MRTALSTALAALAIGLAGLSGVSSLPVRQHCGRDAHRNPWGLCVPDRLRSCPSDWHRNRWGICVRNRY